MRSIPSKDVLLSLVLFGKAFLPPPYWLAESDLPEIQRLQSEELIEWIPEEFCSRAKTTVARLMLRMAEFEEKRFNNPDDNLVAASFDPITEELHPLVDREQRLDYWIESSEMGKDVRTLVKVVRYLDPVLQANMRHLKCGVTSDLVFNSVCEFSSVHMYEESWAGDLLAKYVPSEGRAHLSNPLWVESLQSDLDNEADELRVSLQTRLGASRGPKGLESVVESAIDIARERRVLFDCSIGSLIVDRFASERNLPVKSARLDKSSPFAGASHQKNDRHATLEDDAEYQLLRVQFKSLRYPVIENIEDVLRLREDPRLDAYRAVIREYGDRLREDLEGERAQVLREFEHDVELAAADLRRVSHKEQRVSNFIFYVSIPLAILGWFAGVPLSDALGLALTGHSKAVSKFKRKRLDWLLFGQSG